MVAGSFINETEGVVERVLVKTSTGITIGQVLYYDTSGFAPATATIVGAATNEYRKYVALESLDASASARYVRAARAGVVGVLGTFTSGAAIRGCKVRVSATAGKVTYHTKPTDAATALLEVGTLYADVASGDTGAWVDLNQ